MREAMERREAQPPYRADEGARASFAGLATPLA
jgi:hypothetical protein